MRPNSEGRIGLPIVKIQYALITSMIYLGQPVNTVLAARTNPNVFHITMFNLICICNQSLISKHFSQFP